MNLSRNFTLKEMTQSQTALRNNIDNEPDEQQIENIKNLVVNILQPLRDYYQVPLKVTSGFRIKANFVLVLFNPILFDAPIPLFSFIITSMLSYFASKSVFKFRSKEFSITNIFENFGRELIQL